MPEVEQKVSFLENAEYSVISQFGVSIKNQTMGLINILTLLPALAWAQCPSSTLEFPITSDMGGLRFVGFNPTVSRFSGGGMVSLNIYPMHFVTCYSF